MNSLILQIAVRILYPVMLLLSLLLLFRGHHQPGGGFIGGLVAASAIIFKTFVSGNNDIRWRRNLNPIVLIISGLCMAFSAAVIPVFAGMQFFEGWWAEFYLPLIGRPGTPMLFDTGVYFLVLGIVCKIIFSISD
jgi:multicomponent Na+:H+ antiporter subunit B